MSKHFLKHTLAVVMLGMTTLALAEEAPVYDADNFPPQFEGQQLDSNAPPPAAPAYNPPSSLSVEQRITRAEHQISNIQNKDLSTRVESLQTEVQALRGQVEQLNRQVQQMQTQQRAQFSDLDKRIGKAAAPAAPLPSSTATENQTPDNDEKDVAESVTSSKTKTPPPVETTTKTKVTTPVAATKDNAADLQPNVAEEQQIYQTAYDLIKVKKYNEAIAALQKMLQKYPTGQFAANAHYWLGELYGLLGKNDESSKEFDVIVKSYPDSPKVADAQLKLGLIYSAQFKWADAKSAFKKVINHYPGTATARLAAEQLKQIKEAGH